MPKTAEPRTKTCKGCKQTFTPRNGHQHYCEACRPVKPEGAGRAKGDLAAALRQAMHQAVAEEVAAQLPATVQAEVTRLLQEVFAEVAAR